MGVSESVDGDASHWTGEVEIVEGGPSVFAKVRETVLHSRPFLHGVVLSAWNHKMARFVFSNLRQLTFLASQRVALLSWHVIGCNV